VCLDLELLFVILDFILDRFRMVGALVLGRTLWWGRGGYYFNDVLDKVRVLGMKASRLTILIHIVWME